MTMRAQFMRETHSLQTRNRKRRKVRFLRRRLTTARIKVNTNIRTKAAANTVRRLSRVIRRAVIQVTTRVRVTIPAQVRIPVRVRATAAVRVRQAIKKRIKLKTV